MIPQTLLLAFLSLQSSSQPRTSQGSAEVETIGQPETLSVPTTFLDGLKSTKQSTDWIANGPDGCATSKHHTGDTAQVPIQPSSGEEIGSDSGPKVIDFNNVSPGFYDPDDTGFPDGFEVLAQPYVVSLEDAFPDIKPPSGIKKAWASYPYGRHFGFFFRGPTRPKDVTVEFGFIENDNLLPGAYGSTVWTLSFQGWRIEEGPSGKFDGSGWANTTTTKNKGDRFEYDFRGGGVDSILVITRIYYTPTNN